MKTKQVLEISPGVPTIEGAGVNLSRAFGFHQVPRFDPFLLFDDFHSTHAADYTSGFPWHPHRGIETVTYVVSGKIEHQDSMGNRGQISTGDVQWMTAGSGIIHQEMPQATAGLMQGFQLWINLPRSNKMMAPRYRDVQSSQIPVVSPENGLEIRIVAGRIGEVSGPVQDIVVPIEYLDVRMQGGMQWEHPIDEAWRTFAYVIGGEVIFPGGSPEAVGPENLVLFQLGGDFSVHAGRGGAHFLLASGRPIGEPVAWGGPIVMNTQEELDQAFREYQNNTFIKHE